MPLSEPHQPHIPDAMAFTDFAVVTVHNHSFFLLFKEEEILESNIAILPLDHLASVYAVVTFANRIHGFWLS